MPIRHRRTPRSHFRKRQQSPTLTRLAAGFKRFQTRWFCTDHNLYEDLREGQDPLALVIACSDSRVDPVLLTDSRPGDLFVIRNVANIVPPYAPDNNYHGVSAALEYAVRHLRVKDIIVMGHANCGGVQSLLEADSSADNEFLSVWMQVIHQARDLVNRILPNASPEERCRACEQWGIRVSLDNLLTFPWIRHAVDDGDLTLHGWYFDLENGELQRLDEDVDKFVPLVKRCAAAPLASDPALSAGSSGLTHRGRPVHTIRPASPSSPASPPFSGPTVRSNT